MQEALALGLQKVHQLRNPDRLNAWLYSILNNCWKQCLRWQRSHGELGEQRPSEMPDSATSQLETVTRVRRAVAALPFDQRQVPSLVDLEGFVYCEVAKILDIPVGAVMSRLHRGRKALLPAVSISCVWVDHAMKNVLNRSATVIKTCTSRPVPTPFAVFANRVSAQM